MAFKPCVKPLVALLSVLIVAVNARREGNDNVFWAPGDDAAQRAAATVTTPVILLQGRFHIWGDFEGDTERAYLFVDTSVLRLLNWEQHRSLAGLGTEAQVTVTGHRVQGPVMDFLNVLSLTVDVARPEPPSSRFAKAVDPLRAPSRGLRQEVQCSTCNAVTIKPRLKIIVVRPRLPSSCPNVRTLVGGCSQTTWEQVLFSNADSVNNQQTNCTWGAVSYDESKSLITAYVDIPCTSLLSSLPGYCGDEVYAWMNDAQTALARQGINTQHYDHVIYDMPQMYCYWAGASTIPGSFIFMNAQCPTGVVLHELGHNYGNQHSNLVLPDSSYWPYRDYSCEMGAGTTSGRDAKCYSLPHMTNLGIATPHEVNASNLPEGKTLTFTLGTVWSSPSQGIMIDVGSITGFTSDPTKYYISLQADAGPNTALKNMYMFASAAAGVLPTLYRKVIEIHKSPGDPYSDPNNVRLAVLGANSKWTLNDIGAVVRPESFAQDGSFVVVSLCRIGSGNTCSQPVVTSYPEQYWMFRTNDSSCLTVCMDAAGSGCQPSSFNTTQQRLVVFYPNCNSRIAGDGSAVWYFDGLLIRNKLTGWCLDPVLAQGQVNPGPIVVAPCKSNGDNAGDSPIQQMWMWGQGPGTAVTLPQQDPNYFSVLELDRFVNRWVAQRFNVCPGKCTTAACNALMPNPGLASAFAYSAACTDASTAFSLASAFSFTPAELGIVVPSPSPSDAGSDTTPSPSPPPRSPKKPKSPPPPSPPSPKKHSKNTA